jgi:hypothetical protein
MNDYERIAGVKRVAAGILLTTIILVLIGARLYSRRQRKT